MSQDREMTHPPHEHASPDLVIVGDTGRRLVVEVKKRRHRKRFSVPKSTLGVIFTKDGLETLTTDA